MASEEDDKEIDQKETFNPETVRPRDPFLRFFQDCLMASKSDPDDEYSWEAFFDRKAAEHGIPPTEIRTTRRIATYVARTPMALVEVRRQVGIDPVDDVPVEVMMAFVVPAFGKFLDMVSYCLQNEGYELRHVSTGEMGENDGLAFEHPEKELIVTIRTYDLWPLAQGIAGFKEMVKICADTLESADLESPSSS